MATKLNRQEIQSNTSLRSFKISQLSEQAMRKISSVFAYSGIEDIRKGYAQLILLGADRIDTPVQSPKQEVTTAMEDLQ